MNTNNSIYIVRAEKKVRLQDLSTSHTGEFAHKEDAQKKLKQDIGRLSKLQEVLYAEGRRALLIIFQGMDTSGKDSMIKHVMRGVNPQGCEVRSFKAPSAEELAHGYLWRCEKAVPARGNIGIFNRSYYEEVTIARVHAEILKKQNLPKSTINGDLWKHRFEEINAYEQYLTQNGTSILKFFLHISPQEQKQRLLKRLNDETKHWKFDVSDIREREFWDKYIATYDDALSHTATAWAPWHIVPADQKWSARVAVANAIVKKLASMKLEYPELSKQGMANLKKAKELLDTAPITRLEHSQHV